MSKIVAGFVRRHFQKLCLKSFSFTPDFSPVGRTCRIMVNRFNGFPSDARRNWRMASNQEKGKPLKLFCDFICAGGDRAE